MKQSIDMRTQKMGVRRSSISTYRDTDATAGSVACASSMEASFLRNWLLHIGPKSSGSVINSVIGPDKTINETVVRDNWDDLLRLVATIELKENTVFDIFRRLNSHSRQHALYQTLKVFGQIAKSLFILRYVDDLALRQAIEKQTNKVELANRFARAVVVGNPLDYTQTENEEQEIAEACNRLIRHSIICWNYLYFT